VHTHAPSTSPSCSDCITATPYGSPSRSTSSPHRSVTKHSPSRANSGLCTAQHSGRAQYAPVGTDATPRAMCELSSAEVRGAAESHMQMLQHHTRLQRRDGRLLLRLTRQFRCPGPTARRTVAKPPPWISSEAQPGGTVCTDVRCFNGTLSACWTYRQSTSARSHLRDPLRMHARTAKSSSLHGPRVVSRPRAIGCGASILRQCRTTRRQAVPCSELAVACHRASGPQCAHGESTPEYQSGLQRPGVSDALKTEDKRRRTRGVCKLSLKCPAPPLPTSTASTASARQACGTSSIRTATPAPATPRAIFATP
jgi:hypothetical protein